MKKIKVDKVILYYMDRVDPDGNLYRFYVYKGMASEIEYFCTEKAGNMTIPIGEGEYVKIVPKEIEKIPVRGYRKLTGIWNRETCNGKGWYRLFNYFKYKPTLCYFKKAGHDENGNTRYEISLFNNIINVTRYFNLWRMKPGEINFLNTPFYIPGEKPNAWIRIKGNIIETSKQIKIGIAEARKLWRAVSAMHRGAEFRHGLVEDITGHQWSLNRYENDLLTAGCHRIAYNEMERIAKQLGWV